ncbi:hypothetical protein [Actinosynnema pretiosum]|uniref:Uncharacterized protein n=1 Tax=Actinosynnema pretiosum TaxID=42197 RepID=A0A290Z8U6_9PSEU|nr:hypothetical protein [Actinosynnema pretiosum]ATE55416.1 hypothetical protein CNX65_20770 [Actinosynnema pretiosum]
MFPEGVVRQRSVDIGLAATRTDRSGHPLRGAASGDRLDREMPNGQPTTAVGAHRCNGRDNQRRLIG